MNYSGTIKGHSVALLVSSIDQAAVCRTNVENYSGAIKGPLRAIQLPLCRPLIKQLFVELTLRTIQGPLRDH